MPHTIVLGVSMSGKSTYAKMICEGLTQRGIETVVLNPYGDPDWKCTFQSDDPANVMGYCHQRKTRAVFLEEAGDSLKRDPVYDWFTCRGRHFGNGVWVISQRLNDLSPALRNNCTEAVVFASEMDDTKTLASKYREPLLLNVGKFRPGQFYVVSQFADTRIGQLDFASRNISLGKAVKRAA